MKYPELADLQRQRIPSRDKKASFNEQCKEIQENNKMGKTRDLFKKTGDIKGTFHVRMSMIRTETVST